MIAMKQARPAVKRRTLLAAVVLAAGLGCASHALADPSPVELKLVDRSTGRTLPFWRRHGRLFVAGEPGTRYGLRISNHTGGRVLLVLSIDGVNVLTGETAKYDQRGYVVDAHDSYDVNGWRKSQNEVAAFTFAPLHESYAGRTGRPDDVGVVGMAVFKERAPAPDLYAAAARDRLQQRETRRGFAPPPPPPLALPSVAAPAPARSIAGETSVKSSIAPRADEKLGTAHGERELSSISLVDFERATSAPQSIRRIEYDTAAHLLAHGVTPPHGYADAAEHRPRPFPQESDRSGFVPDPPEDR